MTIDLQDLPLADLRAWLHTNMSPNGDQYLEPQSVGASSIAALPAGGLSLTAGVALTGAGTWTDISFTLTNWVNGGVVASSFGLKVPVDGLYLVSGALSWDAVNVGFNYEAGVTVNGSANRIWGVARDSRDVGALTQPFSILLRLPAASVVGLAAWSSDAAGGVHGQGWTQLRVQFVSNTVANDLAGNVA